MLIDINSTNNRYSNCDDNSKKMKITMMLITEIVIMMIIIRNGMGQS